MEGDGKTEREWEKERRRGGKEGRRRKTNVFEFVEAFNEGVLPLTVQLACMTKW